MKEPIFNINNDFIPEDLPNESDFEDEDLDDEWWVKGKKRLECSLCFGIGCTFCNDLGYTISKR